MPDSRRLSTMPSTTRKTDGEERIRPRVTGRLSARAFPRRPGVAPHAGPRFVSPGWCSRGDRACGSRRRGLCTSARLRRPLRRSTTRSLLRGRHNFQRHPAATSESPPMQEGRPAQELRRRTLVEGRMKPFRGNQAVRGAAPAGRGGTDCRRFRQEDSPASVPRGLSPPPREPVGDLGETPPSAQPRRTIRETVVVPRAHPRRRRPTRTWTAERDPPTRQQERRGRHSPLRPAVGPAPRRGRRPPARRCGMDRGATGGGEGGVVSTGGSTRSSGPAAVSTCTSGPAPAGGRGTRSFIERTPTNAPASVPSNPRRIVFSRRPDLGGSGAWAAGRAGAGRGFAADAGRDLLPGARGVAEVGSGPSSDCMALASRASRSAGKSSLSPLCIVPVLLRGRFLFGASAGASCPRTNA